MLLYTFLTRVRFYGNLRCIHPIPCLCWGILYTRLGVSLLMLDVNSRIRNTRHTHESSAASNALKIVNSMGRFPNSTTDLQSCFNLSESKSSALQAYSGRPRPSLLLRARKQCNGILALFRSSAQLPMKPTRAKPRRSGPAWILLIRVYTAPI